MRMIRFVCLPALAVLAACGTTPQNEIVPAENAAVDAPVENAVVETPAATPEVATPLLNITPGGIAMVDATSGSSRELKFDSAKETVATAAARALGEPKERGENTECGEGAMQYETFADGLTLWFQKDKLVGWFLQGTRAKLTTASGVGIGSTYKAVRDVYTVEELEGSTLGREFSTGNSDLSGLLEGKGDGAKVTALWSGRACLFR